MSDTDPTPFTPLTIGDRLAWFRGDMVAGFAALSTQLSTQHMALLAKLDSITGSATLGQLLTAIQAGPSGGATETTAAAILAAIGTLASNPANYTVKDLLALLNANINTTPPDIVVDPNLCGGTWDFTQQIATIQFMASVELEGAGWDIYAPIIPPYVGYTQNITDQIVNFGIVTGVQTRGYVQYCASWDYSYLTSPIPITHVSGIGVNPLFPWPIGVTFAEATGTAKGNIGGEFHVDGHVSGYRIAVPTGSAPPKPYWWFHASFVPFGLS